MQYVLLYQRKGCNALAANCMHCLQLFSLSLPLFILTLFNVLTVFYKPLARVTLLLPILSFQICFQPVIKDKPVNPALHKIEGFEFPSSTNVVEKYVCKQIIPKIPKHP